MLQRLAIRNFAIIDHLEIEFSPGLNVLTGETGAGKSIIMGALTAILGGRTGAELVRSGADRALIDGEFDIGGSLEIQRLVEDLGFETEDGTLLLCREIGAGGKSTARIGGRPAAISQLRQIGDWLADLHGQHEHQSLLAVSRHLDMLDEWGGGAVLALREQSGATFQRVRALEEERAALETDSRERARLIDLYEFQSKEIRDAELCPGDDEALRVESRRLTSAQKLTDAAAVAVGGLSGEAGVLDSLTRIAGELEAAALLDDRLSSVAETVRSAQYALEEASRDVAGYADEIEFNPARQQQIEDRLDLIHTLRRKYGETIEEILSYRIRVDNQLETLTHSEERGQELSRTLAGESARLESLCRELTTRRRAVAQEFAAAVRAELTDLAMEKTLFEVVVEPETPGPRGADRVEFLISPNPGEPLRPLARIASGGEISRVMLAIKSAMARQEALPTMVFDEIDAGVGGRTAGVIAAKLSALAASAQIICITHLPQIASRAERHLYIEKQVVGERTLVGVERLSPDARVDELARMLGGAETTETVRRHARELLQAG